MMKYYVMTYKSLIKTSNGLEIKSQAKTARHGTC